MAKFELTVYGENDEPVKKYETDRIRWGVLMKGVEVAEKIKDAATEEKTLEEINGFLKSVFVGLTDEDLAMADGMDVMNTFSQIIATMSGKVQSGGSKNS